MISIRRTLYAIPTLAVCLWAIAPSSVEAQACFYEYWCTVEGWIGDKLGQGPAPGGVHAAPSFWHSNCLICDGFEPCHYECGSGQGGGDDLEQVAYSRVVEAFGNRDLAGILAYARAGGEKILWNPARKAVQLRNCSGELVIASLRVADADIAYIRSAVSAWSEIEPQ